MKILVIDREQLTAQMIASRLKADGHQVIGEAVKNDGLERIAKESFDVVFIDPSPMKDAQAMALNIRRASKSYPYIIFMNADEEMDLSVATKMGCNDFIVKPLDPLDIQKKVASAANLKKIIDHLGNTLDDFPSAGGVIAKSAFNQLFLSAIDRSGRYNELAFVLSVTIDNYQEIKDLDGEYNANYSVSKLAYHMVRLRRQSDIIGQTAVNEYSILLQRTQNLKEAMDAANRFAVTLDEIDDFLPSDGHEIKIHFALTDVPTGALSFEHTLHKKLTFPAQ